jgi:hypothetical protein
MAPFVGAAGASRSAGDAMSLAGTSDVAASCAACELDFDYGQDLDEAAFFVRTHNELHHAGRPEAVLVEVSEHADVVEAAAEEYGEQGREQAAEALAQGQGDLWLDLALIDQPADAVDAVAVGDVDEAGW